ncbi:MAG: hypothetical protein V3T22_09065 [Planctomycetota bacterium]
MTSFAPLAQELAQAGVRYVLIGVAGVNLYAHDAGVVFSTMDRDVFLPPDSTNLLAAWNVCEERGLRLTSSGEPLDEPRDLFLSQRVVERRAMTRADDGSQLVVDLTLVMTGFEFEEVWAQRAIFLLRGVEVPVARLAHIIASKAAAGREKDRLFLATHAEVLRKLLPREEPGEAQRD